MAITLNSDNGFYSNQLANGYKELYALALNKLSNKRFTASIAMDYDADIFQSQTDIFARAVVYEHPELFFVRQQVNFRYNNGKMVVVFESIYDEDLINEYDEYLNKKIDTIAELMKPYAEDPMTLLYKLNEYIASQYEGEDAYTRDNGNALGVVLNGKARCEGFCKVAKLVLNKFKIDSIICLGDVSPNNDPFPHAWLAIFYNDKYYGFDIAYNVNRREQNSPGPVYTFMDKKSIETNRRPDFNYPITDDTSLLFWKLHNGETYHISDLMNAELIEQEHCFITVHHLVDFEPLSEEQVSYQVRKWIEANLAPYTRGNRFRFNYIDDLQVLIVYYFND